MRYEFSEVLQQLLVMHPEYKGDAYRYIYLITNPLSGAKYDSPDVGPPKHITARMLYKELCRQALSEFGPLAATVFRVWGLHSVQDVARATYYMVEAGLLSTRKGESISDFDSLPPLQKALSAF